MKITEFNIGQTFWMSGNEWVCTDIGTRTIVAIKLGDRSMTRYHSSDDDTETYVIKLTLENLGRPPYAYGEHVLDEYDLDACYRTNTKIY